MTISNDEWKQMESQLSGTLGSVKLDLDGKTITLGKVFVKENRLAIIVYVDDRFSWAWGDTHSEMFDPMVEQIWRKRSRAIYSPKKQKDIIKIFGKRDAKKRFPELEEKIYWFVPYFLTFASLKRQYKKLESLKVISIGYSET